MCQCFGILLPYFPFPGSSARIKMWMLRWLVSSIGQLDVSRNVLHLGRVFGSHAYDHRCVPWFAGLDRDY